MDYCDEGEEIEKLSLALVADMRLLHMERKYSPCGNATLLYYRVDAIVQEAVQQGEPMTVMSALKEVLKRGLPRHRQAHCLLLRPGRQRQRGTVQEPDCCPLQRGQD